MGRPRLVICGRRNCAKCGRWRHVSDFSANRRDPETGEVLWLNGYCVACEHARMRERAEDPLWRLAKAEYARIRRRLRAEQEGRTIAAYPVKSPWTGRRMSVERLNAELTRRGVVFD
jgi:hypothetical protein